MVSPLTLPEEVECALVRESRRFLLATGTCGRSGITEALLDR
ncbi:hypothetical protein [Streptomyces sp. NBC_00443]